MKVEVKSKKGLRTILSVIVDKKSIQTKMEEKLGELQKEVALKGFRPGKVPPAVIKSQFGKSIYGEVVDKILRETSSKAINEKKLKIAGQPKIDLKQFGEGKDLNYELQIDCLPSVALKSFDKFKATNFKVKIEDKIIEEKLKEIANQNKQFEDKNENEKAINGDQVIFDYSASVDGNKFEGTAKKKFIQVTGWQVFDIGLVCKDKFSWFGGSPDGLVHCKLSDDFGLLEIKCPFKCKDDKELIAKSRMVIPGHEDPQFGLFRTDAPTTSPLAVLVCATIAVSLDWGFEVFDVSTAFLSGMPAGTISECP